MDSLAEATVWAAGEPAPIEYDVFASVETAAHYSKEMNTYLIMFVNATSNQLTPQPIVRYVATLSDVKVKLNNVKNIKSVRSVVGTDLTWEIAGDDCLINLSKLSCYDALIVELI